MVLMASAQRLGGRQRSGGRRDEAATAARCVPLLQRKADVNTPQVDGTTALHWAVASTTPTWPTC